MHMHRSTISCDLYCGLYIFDTCKKCLYFMMILIPLFIGPNCFYELFSEAKKQNLKTIKDSIQDPLLILPSEKEINDKRFAA